MNGDWSLQREPDKTVTASAPAPGSVFARAAASRQKRLENRTLTLEVPEWAGEMRATYRFLVEDDWDVLNQKHAGNPDKRALDYDVLIESCVGVELLIDGTWHTVTYDGIDARYDQTLARAFGWTCDSARQVVDQVVAGNRLALTEHARKVAAWMRDTSREVDGQIVGESKPTRPPGSPAAS